ncbi:MAG: caspase family protein [Rhodoferax sp.]|nr:caspase family protein [Rhodoferax sp.]
MQRLSVEVVPKLNGGLFVLVGAFMHLSALAANVGSESRLALLIGNSTYKSSPLVNPVNDVRLMESALKDSGFQVIRAENASIREMRRLVRDFGDKLKMSGGVGLFYFAGHGVQVRGENFLVSTDSDIRNEDEVADDSVNANVILEKMQNAGNRMNLIILDACRNNPFANKSRNAASGLANMSAPSGSIVAFSTAPGSVASDGAGKNGLYTEHLAKVIRESDLSVEEVFKKVRAAVRKESNNQQTPWENTALEGQFYFRTPLPAPAQDINGVGPTPLEMVFWDSAKAATTSPELVAYLKRFPTGFFSELAKARIAAMSSLASEKGIAEGRLKANAERIDAEEKQKADAERIAAELKQKADAERLAAEARVKENAERIAAEEKQNAEASEVQKIEHSEKMTVSGKVGDLIGTLVFKDYLTGLFESSLEVTLEESSAEKIAYSSGDIIERSGKVLQVRIGNAVFRFVSGILWTFPLRTGQRGEAKIQLMDVVRPTPGTIKWEIVAVDENKIEIQANVEYELIDPSGVRSYLFGKWSGTYKANQYLPYAFSSKIHSFRLGNWWSSSNAYLAEFNIN